MTKLIITLDVKDGADLDTLKTDISKALIVIDGVEGITVAEGRRELPMLKFTIPLAPITKKNSQRILKNSRTGAHFVAPSEQYENYEAAALWYVPRRSAPIDIPVNVKCIFYMPTARLCDLPNHLEAIDDIMVKAGLIKDDNYNIVASHDGSRVRIDRQNPRTEVEITNLEE